MQLSAEEQALQAGLILTPATSLAPSMPTIEQPPAQPKVQPRTTTTRKPSSFQFLDQLTESLAYLGGAAIAAGLWIAGAFFTLVFLRTMGVNLASLAWGQWLIPATITACELKLWPRQDGAWQRSVVWFLVLGFDVGTSFKGLIVWGAGREVPLFTGWVIPSGGWVLNILALVVALAFAFGPEQLARWAVPELRNVWAKK